MKIINHTMAGVPSFGTSAVLVTVLTKDQAGLHAAYRGIIPSNADAAPKFQANLERVAASGQKLNLKKAQEEFSGLDEANYRR